MFQTKQRKFRATRVVSSQQLSPHLQRIIVGGEDLHDFPLKQDGVHVKAILSPDGQPLNENNRQSAIKRSYTIREFDAANKHLVLDFVINRHSGPATDWARNAKIGDYLGIGGPGERKLTNFAAHSYLLVGDITAVNAVNGYAKFISPDAQLVAVVSVPTRGDVIAMDAGEHLHVHWHIEDETDLSLSEFVQPLIGLLAKDSEVFLGLEATQIRSLKSLLLHELGFSRLNIHATGYWKKGMDADRFGADKKRNPL